ncbi:aminotransferase class I/II-fold pyridoxal phosphate-dependent enzyme [Aeromicrobium sp.]|uniref:MalY/PatB family protein n=1 Tax=Aeromicrobium sp. TaxID=1871063 RepID=UPI0019AFE4D9|nr:aminotransferase class I/II-fold pyridoxal phosphate-dependent enzyme [Aeromicrobium sp.]MBC7631393.1 aminotransferase class I/II-fold pyridoxal phosphate-dependent enzyme [Aeromicrobium sp.]
MTEIHPLRELSLEDLRRRTSVKWREHPTDVLPLWVAEMDVRLAEPVARSVTEAIDEGDTGYPHGDGYAEAYAGFAIERWRWHGVDPSRTLLVADVMTGIVEAVGLVSEPGDPVVVNPPVYPPFFGYVEHAARTIVEAPLGADGRLDLESLEAAFVRAGAGGRSVTYLLCNPHNPTATVHTLDELSSVAALAKTHRVRVVVDEIHAPLVAGDYVPYLSVPGTDDAFSIASASKAWNLAGMKAALLVAGEESAADLARLPEVVSHGPSHFGVISHTAAFRHGGPWLDALQVDLEANRELLTSLLSSLLPDIVWGRGTGTYLAWLDCRSLGLGDDPAASFLERGRVAVNSGLPFGAGGAGHVRLNYATTPEILTEAIERIAHSLR